MLSSVGHIYDGHGNRWWWRHWWYIFAISIVRSPLGLAEMAIPFSLDRRWKERDGRVRREVEDK